MIFQQTCCGACRALTGAFKRIELIVADTGGFVGKAHGEKSETGVGVRFNGEARLWACF
jgi:hypothetical protein